MIVSYAQNFEDVRLWRALGHIANGCYVDIGAQDPIVDSVSRAFYEKGWRGLHVEPSASYAARLAEDRPGETVIQALVAADPGLHAFFEFPDTGLSTAERAIAERHAAAGHPMREVTVPAVTLAAVLDSLTGREVHWLKVDVEGFEHEVLRSWGDSPVRPWVLVVESTLPMTQTESHEDWERMVIGRGYRFVCFDGLNRYYVSASHAELDAAFSVAPNVFDGFSLSGTATAPFSAVVNGRLRDLEVAAAIADATARSREEELRRNFAAEAQEVQATLQKSRDESAVLAAELAARERAFAVDSLAHEREKLRLSDSIAVRERELGEQAVEREREHGARFVALQGELASLGRTLAERERVHGERLASLHREHILMRDAISAKERVFGEQLAAARGEFERLVHAEEAKIRELRAELEARQQEVGEVARAMCSLELRFSAQLHFAQTEVARLVDQQRELNARHELQLAHEREAASRMAADLGDRVESLHGIAGEQRMRLQAVFSSRSWRLMAPLRRLTQWLRQIAGRQPLEQLEQTAQLAVTFDHLVTSRSRIPAAEPKPLAPVAASICHRLAMRESGLPFAPRARSPDSVEERPKAHS